MRLVFTLMGELNGLMQHSKVTNIFYDLNKMSSTSEIPSLLLVTGSCFFCAVSADVVTGMFLALTTHTSEEINDQFP